MNTTNPTSFNKVVTNEIRYTPLVKAVNSTYPFSLETYPNTWGESNEVIEKTFVFKFTPNVADAASGNTLSPSNQFPFTYLTVPIPEPEEGPGGSDPEEELYRVFQYNALYVDATIFYFNSPEGIYDNSNNTVLVPGGINFEHFGCILSRGSGAPITDTQQQFFDSQLVINNLVNKKHYTTSFGNPSQPEYVNSNNLDIADIYPISQNALANPINFNYELSQFECKLTANPYVNIPDTSNFGETYSMIIKGRYLLM